MVSCQVFLGFNGKFLRLKANTRDKLLAQAEILFAQKGFYGTSINDVAAELSISKQGLLHHFPSKEKLYAAVLQESANYLLDELREGKSEALSPYLQLIEMLDRLMDEKERTIRVIVLLIRELLDNRERAESAHQWFLKPVLDEFEALVVAAQKKGMFVDVHPLSFVYQLLGAVQYYLISQPTLKQLYSSRKFNAHKRQHIVEIKRWLEAIK